LYASSVISVEIFADHFSILLSFRWLITSRSKLNRDQLPRAFFAVLFANLIDNAVRSEAFAAFQRRDFPVPPGKAGVGTSGRANPSPSADG